MTKPAKDIKAAKYDKTLAARIPLTILKLLAVWPWKLNKKSNCQILLSYLIHVPTTVIFTMLIWLEIFTTTDSAQAENTLHFALTLTVNVIKLLNLLVLSKAVTFLIIELEQNTMYDLLTTEEADIWMQQQRAFRKIEIIYIGCCQFACVFMFIGPLLGNEYRLGVPCWLPFEWRNPERYWYAYFYDLMSILVHCNFAISVDMLVCYMIFHIGLLYQILTRRYSSISHANEVQAIQYLKNLFLLHASIKRTTKKCESLISNFILTLLIFSALIICFCGYRLRGMNILAELDQFLYMLFFLFSIVLQIYLPCHFATKIQQNSEKLLFNIYDCNWLEFSTNNRKFLHLYMEFFKEPREIRAGKYFKIGLPIFKKVINNAYSFLALLLNMEKENKEKTF